MVKVKVLESFSAFGREFLAGEIIDPTTDLVMIKTDEDGNEISRTPWDTGTISRRFQNGFLGYNTDPAEELFADLDEDPSAPVTVTDPTGNSEVVTDPTAGEPARGRGRAFTLPK